MFGFGFLEIALLVGLVVLVFGAGRAGELFRTGFRVYRQVDKTKQEVKSTFSLGGLFDKNKKD